MQKQTLVEAQETAGFFEGGQRVCLGGLFNNLFFFSILGKGASSEPTGKLMEAINKHFTDFNGFKEAFKKAVQSRYLPGWVWLGILPDGKLMISQTNKQDNNLMMGVSEIDSKPIIALDLWEHAYWLDHEGDPSESYLTAFWEVVDWAKVSENYEKFTSDR